MKNVMKTKEMVESACVNLNGGRGYKTNFKETLVEFFSLGLLNGNFYQTQVEVLKNARELFERALKECPEFATKCAIYGATEGCLKLVPTIWLVYLSTLEDKSLFKQAFPRIIRNPKMMHDFMDICRKAGIRQGVGSGVKNVMNQWLYEQLNEYQASRNKTKLAEIIKVTRPSTAKMLEDKTFQSYLAYISGKGETFERAIALKQVLESLEEGNLEEETLFLIQKHGLQLEELKHSTSKLSIEDKQVLYRQIYKSLNYSALILNLVALERVFAIQMQTKKVCSVRTFTQSKVVETDIPQSLIDMIVAKIKDVQAYKRSKMLPFALLNAQEMVVTPAFKEAIGEMFAIVANDVFDIDKEIGLFVAVDTSASMTSTINGSVNSMDVASLFASMVKKAHAKTRTFAVATEIKKVSLMKQDNVLKMAHDIKQTRVGHGTYFEQIMDKYKGEQYALLLTDSECADNLEKQWLKKKAEGAKLIVWQLNPLGTHLSKHESVVYVSGYSDRLILCVKRIIEGKTCQMDEVEKIEL